ncbi:Abi family protein [Legionella shakespearei]|uniref:Abi-like protein n=1 Tax=Legionella shakespearei DSM 23087 TaxID=1122169 RepID=A0A0W0YKH1_9GAMM|nr:Abi family protein [Legionella shakespearei]KTD57376.1 Abi-like protein [Legionella shakespearei DSM 23087]
MSDLYPSFFDELSIIFSEERLDGYLNHTTCNHNKTEALAAYSWNIELSQSLYPALQILEISLRNSLHLAISTHFDTEHWFELPFLHPSEQKQIAQVINDLKKRKKPIQSGRIVAELSFGFWTSLFDIRYEHGQILWPRLLKTTFQNLPKSQKTRAFLSRELNRIRFLRNRVFHHEPIWHWKDLSQQHQQILNLTNGLSPAALQFLNLFDHFPESYNKGKEDVSNKLKQIHF